MTYLYLMQTAFFRYKIGISTAPKRRRVEIARSERRKVRLVIAMPIPYAEKVEGLMHAIYKPLRLRDMKGSGKTEWFFFILPITPLALMLTIFLFFIIAAMLVAGIFITGAWHLIHYAIA